MLLSHDVCEPETEEALAWSHSTQALSAGRAPLLEIGFAQLGPGPEAGVGTGRSTDRLFRTEHKSWRRNSLTWLSFAQFYISSPWPFSSR